MREGERGIWVQGRFENVRFQKGGKGMGDGVEGYTISAERSRLFTLVLRAKAGLMRRSTDRL